MYQELSACTDWKKFFYFAVGELCSPLTAWNSQKCLGIAKTKNPNIKQAVFGFWHKAFFKI